MLAGQRGVKVGRAAQLGGERFTVPGGPLVGLSGPAQFGGALIGQLDPPQPGFGDVLVQSVQGFLQVRDADRGQPFGLGLELLPGQLRAASRRLRSVGRSAGTSKPASCRRLPSLGDALVRSAQPGPDRLGAVRGSGRFGVGGLFLITW